MSRRVKRNNKKKDRPWRGQAKKRILFELFYFLIAALVLSGGYTISYFTSQAEVPPNVFTAGTVLVTAGDAEGNLVISDHGDNTWSPGECRELELTIKNTGSKRAYARARFEADWKAQYHTNIATVTANYLPSGQTEPVQIQRNTSVSYSYGDYAGEEEDPTPPPVPPHWFTGFDHTSPLSFISASIVEQTGGGKSAPSNTSAGSPGEMTVLSHEMSPPTVNGLFFGDGDYLRYYPIATVPTGTTLYAYLDEKADGARTLYVALVVSRAVNDNVFDIGSPPDKLTAYSRSAGWTQHRGVERLTDSEFMGFSLTGHDIETDRDITWTWQQCYARQIDPVTGADKNQGSWDSTDPNWVSDHLHGAGLGTPPPGYVSSSSLVWNLKNYALNRLNPNVPKWDVTVGGTRVVETWKSPFDPAFPDDVTRVDGYPPAGQITFSETYGWEWPMVYEFSVDMTQYSPYILQLDNIGSHHSPPKSGPVDERFEGGFKIPGVSIIKEVSLDGGLTWCRDLPWPELPDPLPEVFAPRFRFTIKNTGDIELTDIVVTDNILGDIGTLAGLLPEQTYQFYYTDTDWEAHRPELDPGNVSFQLGAGMSDWVKCDDGYFYYTEPIASGDIVTLRVKVCIAEDPDNIYEGALLRINSYVEAVQATHGAVDDVWPGHPPLFGIPTGPSLRLTKQADRSSAFAGDTINYSITVANNGNVTLNDITVVDTMLGISTTIDSLAPGAAYPLDGSYTVKSSDTGTLVNTATASATHEGHSISAMGSVSVTVAIANPSLSVTKQANRSSAAAGDTINYLIIVANNGNVTLNDITVEDAKLEIITSITSLAPGAFKLFTGSHTVVEENFPGPLVNTATAAATYKETPVNAAASVSVELIIPTPFNGLPNGAYIYIRNNSHDEVLFQKIGDNQALLRGAAGTATQETAITQGVNYYSNFPASIRNGSRLLDKAEAEGLVLSIRANGQDWWTRESINKNRRYYIDSAGTSRESGDTSVHEIRPLLIINGELFVTGGDGSSPANAYKLVVP